MKTTALLALFLSIGLTANAEETQTSIPIAPTESEQVVETVPDMQVTGDVDHGGFRPFKRAGGSSSHYSSRSSYSSSHSSQLTPSCLALLRHKYGQGHVETTEAVRQASIDQTKAQGLLAIGYGAVTGTALGFATGNPVLGVGWGLGSIVAGGIGQSIERAQIRKNGNTMSAAEKILAGVPLSKKEQKDFEKARKKVSKKGYKNKNALNDLEFATIVASQQGVGEQLFCDLDKNGGVRILPQDKKTIKRLAADAKCKFPVTSAGAIPKEMQKMHKNRSGRYFSAQSQVSVR